MGIYMGTYSRYASATERTVLEQPFLEIAWAISHAAPVSVTDIDLEALTATFNDGAVLVAVAGQGAVWYLESTEQASGTVYRWENFGQGSQWLIGRRRKGMFSWDDCPGCMISGGEVVRRVAACLRND